MMSARRDIEIGLDACIAKTLHQGFRSEILLTATTQIEIMNLTVKLVGTGEDAVVCLAYVKAEDGTAEGTHVRELIHVAQNHVKRLVSSP